MKHLKTIVTTISILGLFQVANAQKQKINAAWRALSDYESSLKETPEISFLMKAKENIDQAEQNEDSKKNYRTYAYKCRIYYNLFLYHLKQKEDSLALSVGDKNTRREMAYGFVNLKDFETADQALKQLQQVDTKYFESVLNLAKGGESSSDDDLKLLNIYDQMLVQGANIATGRYKLKQFSEASDYFGKVADMNTNRMGQKDTANYYNACIAAQKAKDFEKIISCNKKMLDLKIASPYNYQTLYDAKMALKDPNGAMQYLSEGRKLFPADVYLMNRETELFLQNGDQQQALKNLELAIEKDPNNAQLHLVLGNVYDNLANPKTKSGKDTTKPANFEEYITKAANHYQKSIDLKPENKDSYFNALYNMGALYSNYGKTLYDKAMEKATITDLAKRQKEYEAQSQEYYKKAIPYLEQALTVKDNDQATMYALRQLYLKSGNEIKAKEMDAKIKSSGK